ncbi:hypothetical protein VNI00_012871 [Paramarasmius palmivorus]|uniref:Malate dehydrogenase n=1 Tax=Paramarasmius palmivorus TaxID=297713 RepID=A0AAW0C0L9_9AGAR
MNILWLLSLTAAVVSAAPTNTLACDVSHVKVAAATLPAQQAPTKYIAFGAGVQKYVCGSDGKYASNGASAILFDISCTYNPKTGDYSLGRVLGRHYFITNPVTGTGLSPKWDFSLSIPSGNNFVVGAAQANIPAPTGSSDVNWLYLTPIQGSLAAEIYRTDTDGGQPPASVSRARCYLFRLTNDSTVQPWPGD